MSKPDTDRRAMGGTRKRYPVRQNLEIWAARIGYGISCSGKNGRSIGQQMNTGIRVLIGRVKTITVVYKEYMVLFDGLGRRRKR